MWRRNWKPVHTKQFPHVSTLESRISYKCGKCSETCSHRYLNLVLEVNVMFPNKSVWTRCACTQSIKGNVARDNQGEMEFLKREFWFVLVCMVPSLGRIWLVCDVNNWVLLTYFGTATERILRACTVIQLTFSSFLQILRWLLSSLSILVYFWRLRRKFTNKLLNNGFHILLLLRFKF